MSQKSMTLAQWVGIRKGASQRATAALTELHREASKAAGYGGLSRTYRPKDEAGETYPSENKKVTLVAERVIEQAVEVETDWWDIVSTCERGNAAACADLVVDGRTLAKDLQVPTLLFLLKRFEDIRTFIDRMPVLDENEDWALDSATDLHRTPVQTSHKTKKIQKPVVLYPATPEHPAQTQLITEDEIVGWWDQVKTSGALTVSRKREILRRVDAMIRAAKFAVEAANGNTSLEKVQIGGPILGYIMNG